MYDFDPHPPVSLSVATLVMILGVVWLVTTIGNVMFETPFSWSTCLVFAIAWTAGHRAGWNELYVRATTP